MLFCRYVCRAIFFSLFFFSVHFFSVYFCWTILQKAWREFHTCLQTTCIHERGKMTHFDRENEREREGERKRERHRE